MNLDANTGDLSDHDLYSPNGGPSLSVAGLGRKPTGGNVENVGDGDGEQETDGTTASSVDTTGSTDETAVGTGRDGYVRRWRSWIRSFAASTTLVSRYRFHDGDLIA